MGMSEVGLARRSCGECPYGPFDCGSAWRKASEEAEEVASGVV